MKGLYTYIQLMIIAACYIIPYVLLRNVNNLSLFFFWSIASIVSIILSIVKLYKKVNFQ